MEFEDPYWFEELFYRDIESWFSADIACCDNCYDDFLKSWPLAYAADNAAFQCSSIDMDCFYSGSRLQDYYTKEQFDYFIEKVKCPRCGSPLKYNIWPYELPFMIDIKAEIVFEEIATIANITPFLILKHDFSIKTYDAIKEIAKEIAPIIISNPLYRARLASEIKIPALHDFDLPPKKYIKEGRYNHAGNPVLYMASDIKTCFYEMRHNQVVAAEIEILKPLKVLDLTNPFDAHEVHSDILGTLIYSALMSAKQEGDGWHKPEYIFSRFLADCAKDAGIMAIKYPSTRMTDNNFNLVIIDPTFTLCTDGRICEYYIVNGIDEFAPIKQKT